MIPVFVILVIMAVASIFCTSYFIKTEEQALLWICPICKKLITKSEICVIREEQKYHTTCLWNITYIQDKIRKIKKEHLRKYLGIEESPKEWTCQYCKALNKFENKHCFHCGSPRRMDETI